MFWSFLDEQTTAGTIRCPKMVYQEIVNGEEPLDDLARWIKTRRQSGLFVDADADVQKAMNKIVTSVCTVATIIRYMLRRCEPLKHALGSGRKPNDRMSDPNWIRKHAHSWNTHVRTISFLLKLGEQAG